MKRDPEWERATLGQLSLPSFTEAVMERLEMGERLYGDAWASRSVDDLAREAQEEALDLAAWTLLACERGQVASDIRDSVLLDAAFARWKLEALREGLQAKP